MIDPVYERQEPRNCGHFGIIETYNRNAGAVLEAPSGVTPEGLVPMCPKNTPLNLCQCGCGEAIPDGRRFVNRHNLRVVEHTPDRAAKISASQKRVWRERRTRSPIGSTRMDRAGGYRVIKVSHDGPVDSRWRLEHMVIMESVIGRPLARSERVHHINVIRTDNDPDNLHLFPNDSEHGLAHASLLRLVDGLLRDGVIVFNRETGRYERS